MPLFVLYWSNVDYLKKIGLKNSFIDGRRTVSSAKTLDRYSMRNVVNFTTEIFISECGRISSL